MADLGRSSMGSEVEVEEANEESGLSTESECLDFLLPKGKRAMVVL